METDRMGVVGLVIEDQATINNPVFAAHPARACGL